MRIEKTTLHGVPVLQVVGDIDHFGATKFLNTAQEALDSDSAHILLDLRDCPYLDSGGIGVLISILKNAKAQSGWMGVVAPCSNVRRLLEIVALTADPDFLVFPDLAGAAERLREEA